MATLRLIDENLTITDPNEVRTRLAPFGIQFEQWEVRPEITPESNGDAVLAAYRERIENVAREGGYTKVDVVDVNPSTPGLDTMLARFSNEHWHDEDEVRFTVYGRGLYHVHVPNGPVAALEVHLGDMIRVPRGTLHWFDLCGDRTIKSVRFFQDPAGWTPHYSESGLEQQHQPLCFGMHDIAPERLAEPAWVNATKA
jgi:1,2-dihydroxy-3-keto-5-methylthiopentene dioxygenase